MPETVIQIDNVWKKYRLGTVGTGTLAHDMNRWWHRIRGKPDPYAKVGEAAASKTEDSNLPSTISHLPSPASALSPNSHLQSPSPLTSDEMWALRGVSLEIKQGEIVGIIGRNGAGKSTLLKILSRVTAPTYGEVRVKGRIASLLEVGTGFHPELTGRENIFLNGAILGMTKAEIKRKLDEIVAFAEIEKFLDTPVKRYSSGMYVRLAFAVAAHLDPEILIVDEVLAVGDAEFQKKCLGKMGEVAKGGRTVLFVSHNMQAITRLCPRVTVVQTGEIVCDASAFEAIQFYTERQRSGATSWKRSDEDPSSILEFESLSADVIGEQPALRLRIKAHLRSRSKHAPAFVAFDIADSYGNPVMQAIPSVEPFLKCSRLTHKLSVTIDLPPLIPGVYSVSGWAGPHNTITLDQTTQCLCFDVITSPSPGRSYPHDRGHGYVVPNSVVEDESANA